MARMEKLGVEVVLGERLELPSVEEEKREGRKTRRVVTKAGKEIEYDLLVSSSNLFESRLSILTDCLAPLQLRCTGQKPNSQLLGAHLPEALNEWGFLKVKPTTQVAVPASSPKAAAAANVYVIGDVRLFSR